MIPFKNGMAFNYGMHLALVVIHSCSFLKQYMALSTAKDKSLSRGYCSLQQGFFCEFSSVATIKSERNVH